MCLRPQSTYFCDSHQESIEKGCKPCNDANKDFCTPQTTTYHSRSSCVSACPGGSGGGDKKDGPALGVLLFIGVAALFAIIISGFVLKKHCSDDKGGNGGTGLTEPIEAW